VFPYRSGIVGIIIDTNVAIIKKLFMFSKTSIGISMDCCYDGKYQYGLPPLAPTK
jgi:hypothetical protein